MKTPRVLLFMLAGLAGGTGLRLAFASPGEPENSRRPRPASGKTGAASTSAATAATSTARPAENDILTATAGARIRLLMSWLPGASEDELLRMADALIKKPEGDNMLALRLLMVRWAEVNPRAMFDWAGTDKKGYSRWYLHHAVLAWARVDFAAAWAAASAGQSAVRTSALLGLATADPDKCLAMLRADPKLLHLSGNAGMDDIVEKLAARDPAGTAALLNKAPASQRMELSGRIARTWVKSDPAAALAWINTLEPAVRTRSLKDAGEWIAAHAPEHLPAMLESIPAGFTRTAVQAAGIAHLAATDPDAARRQLDAMPASPARQYGRALLLKELVSRGDDAGAFALASEFGWALPETWSPSYSESVYGAKLSSRSTTSDPSELNPLRSAMGELLGRTAVRDPAQAAAVLAKCEPEVALSLLMEVPAAHFPAVGEVLFAGGEGGPRQQLSRLAANWMTQDPAAAVSWAAAHDSTMDVFFHHWSHDYPAALEWAATQPAEKRQRLLEETIPGWGLNNSAAVQNAIHSSGLPDAEKLKLSSLLPLLPPPK